MSNKAVAYIRFSTPDQVKGDSLRRQLAVAERYAKDNGLELLDVSFNDLGVSAYSGKNRSKGALGRLIELIDKKIIPPGTRILVESLDRLTREHPTNAMTLLLELINKQMIIVTLDGSPKEYKSEMDMMYLIESLVIMSRAHEESRTKSLRIKQAKEQLKQDAIDGKKKYYINLPFWLERKGDDVVANDKLPVIQYIFDLAYHNHGAYTIASKCNEKYPFKRWTKEYINNLLHNEKVTGRVTINSVVLEDHFPRAVEDDVFYQVQQNIKSRKFASGRSNANRFNVFANVITCGYCQSPVWLTYSKPQQYNKKYEYYRCSTPYRHKAKRVKSWPVDEFDLLFFKFIDQLDLRKIFDRPDDDINKIQFEVEQLDKMIDNLITAIESGQLSDVGRLVTRLSELQDQREQLIRRQHELESEVVCSNQYVDQLLEQLKNGPNTEDLKRKLRSVVVATVKSIKMYPNEGVNGDNLKLFEVELINGQFYSVLVNKYKLDGELIVEEIDFNMPKAQLEQELQ